MKMKPSLFVILLFTTTTMNIRCSKECQEALANLITTLPISVLQIKAGVLTSIPNDIQNIVSTFNSCKNEGAAAGSSKSRLKIDFDVNLNKSYAKNQLNNNFDVNTLPVNGKAAENYSFNFNEPGDYRLVTFCDDKNQVSEANENDNNSGDQFVKPRSASTSTEYQYLLIHVEPNPNFKRKEGQPFVELINRTVIYSK